MKKKIHINFRRVIQLLAAMPFTLLIMKEFEYTSSIILLATVLGGAFYCGYLCPFGLTQELAEDLRKKLKIKRRDIPEKVDKYLRYLRYLMFILISVFSVSVLFKVLEYDPRSNLYMILTGKAIGITMIISILVFFIVSIYYDKVFCKYFCIKGAKYGLLSCFKIFSVKRDVNSCINCKRCDKVCDMGILVSQCDGHVKSPNCINCFKCIKACPKANTLSYGLIEKKKRNKKILIGVLAGITFVVYNSSLSKGQNTSTSTPEKEVIQNELEFFEGSAEGYNGEIKVKVGMDGDEIKKIEVLDFEDDWDWFRKAEEGVIKSIIESQDTEVDVVSGATYSSKGIINATKNALEKIK